MNEQEGKVKIGDYFNDGIISQITKIDCDMVYTHNNRLVSVDYAYEYRFSAMKEDVVQSPTHYTSTKISALDVIDDWELCFRLGNVIKYIKRHRLKNNPLEDLKKAAEYLRMSIEKLENETTTS